MTPENQRLVVGALFFLGLLWIITSCSGCATMTDAQVDRHIRWNKHLRH